MCRSGTEGSAYGVRDDRNEYKDHIKVHKSSNYSCFLSRKLKRNNQTSKLDARSTAQADVKMANNAKSVD